MGEFRGITWSDLISKDKMKYQKLTRSFPIQKMNLDHSSTSNKDKIKDGTRGDGVGIFTKPKLARPASRGIFH